MNTVLVTGASGMIGPVLIRHLLSNGYSVRAYCKTSPPSNLFPPEVQTFVGDITDRASIISAVQGVNVVYHLAARLHIVSPSKRQNGEFWRVNVQGTQVVVEEAARNGVEKFVYFSTVKVYGMQQHVPILETENPNPQTIYAKTKFEGERVVTAAAGLPSVVLRLSAVFGPQLKGSWAKLVAAIEKDRFLPIGSLANTHSLTYVEDVARAALLVSQSSEASDQTYNLVGYETPTLHEILNGIYDALAKPLPQLRIPTFLTQAGVHGLSTLGIFIPAAANTADAIRQLTHNEVYSGATLRNMGFSPLVSLEDAWKATIQSRLS